MACGKFRLVLMEDARDFIESLPRPAANKIYYNIRRVVDGERDADLFKKLTGTKIWEFRTLYGNMTYRLFAFWDTIKEMLVVVTHGIVKKVQKTPHKEIAKAETIMKSYFNER